MEFIVHNGQSRLATSLATSICRHPACGLCRGADGAHDTAATVLAITRRVEMAAAIAGALLNAIGLMA
jgi:hypothetical protein